MLTDPAQLLQSGPQSRERRQPRLPGLTVLLESYEGRREAKQISLVRSRRAARPVVGSENRPPSVVRVSAHSR